MIRRMLVTLSAGSFPMLVAVVAINIRAQINTFDSRLLFIGIWILSCLRTDSILARVMGFRSGCYRADSRRAWRPGQGDEHGSSGEAGN